MLLISLVLIKNKIHGILVNNLAHFYLLIVYFLKGVSSDEGSAYVRLFKQILFVNED